MNKKIALICSNLKVGGAQNVIALSSKRLASLGYDVTVITLSNKKTDFFSLATNVKRIELNKIKKSNNFLTAFFNNLNRALSLRNVLKKGKYSTCISFITEINIITILSSFFLKTKIVISERNDPYKQSDRLIWKILKGLTYPLADIVTANSDKGVVFYKKKIFIRNVLLLPNPIPKPQAPLKNKAINFLSVGKLNHQKGHDILIQAFAKFLKKSTMEISFFLTIAGSGNDKTSLYKLAVSLGIEKNIIWQENKNIYELLKNNSIFVLASRYEGTSNAVIEAISTGTSIIVSKDASHSINFLKNNHNCIIFPTNNVDSLADAMEILVKDDAFKEKLSKNLIKDYHHYYNNFNFEFYWKKLIE